MIARIAGRLCLAALVFGVLSGYFLFDSFHERSEEALAGAEASVVFTGAHERIDAGLQLVAARATPRLFISGANSEAGIFPGRFVPDFSARNPNIDLNRLLACCVELGAAANSTFENARETRAWLRRRHIDGPVALITSRLHMPRALTLLSAAIWPQRVIAYPVEDEAPSTDPLRERALEYVKFLASPAMALAPWLFASRQGAPAS